MSELLRERAIELEDEVAHLRALNAELVELLKKHHTWHRSRPDNGYTDSALYNATDAAIAKAKGGVE